MLRRRDAGESGAMKRRHQKVAGAADAVAGEHAARAIRAMCGRRQSEDEEARERIAESGNGTSPVRLGQIRAAFFACDTLTVRSQPRASLARDDARADVHQVCRLTHDSHAFSFWVAALQASRGT